MQKRLCNARRAEMKQSQCFSLLKRRRAVLPVCCYCWLLRWLLLAAIGCLRQRWRPCTELFENNGAACHNIHWLSLQQHPTQGSDYIVRKMVACTLTLQPHNTLACCTAIVHRTFYKIAFVFARYVPSSHSKICIFCVFFLLGPRRLCLFFISNQSLLMQTIFTYINNNKPILYAILLLCAACHSLEFLVVVACIFIRFLH